MDNQKISMPTEAEKQRAIARILDAGLPRRVAFGRELREVLQRIGPRALLFGVGDCLALSLLIWALCLLSALFVAGSTGSLAPALFLFSPLLYAALSLLTAWKNLQTGIWGVDLDLPGLRPDGGGPADAVLRRGVRTGVCPGKYAVVDLHRAGDAPGLDAGTVSGQPVSVWRSPCCASGCGDLPGGWRRRPAGF